MKPLHTLALLNLGLIISKQENQGQKENGHQQRIQSIIIDDPDAC